MQYLQNLQLTTTLINDVPSLVKFSMTCKDGKKYASKSIFNQFSHLLSHFNMPPCEIPSLENRIIVQLLEIKKQMNEQKDEKGVVPLKPFQEAFDLLKLFYHTLPANRNDGFLELYCPSLIKEMIAPDEDASIWINSTVKESQPRVNSLIKELKKIKLFYDEHSSLHPFRTLPFNNYIGGSFFATQNGFWDSHLYFAIYSHGHIENKYCNIGSDSKWQNIIHIYNDCFNTKINEKFVKPMDDLKDKWKEKELYEKICLHVTGLDHYSTSSIQKLTLSDYCLRPSSRDNDIYGNPKTVFSFRREDDRYDNQYLDLSKFKSIEEFDLKLNDLVCKLPKENVYNGIRRFAMGSNFQDTQNPKLAKGQYCLRLSGSENDSYGHKKIVFTYKNLEGTLLNSRFDLEALNSIDEFKLALQARIDKITRT